MRDELFDDVWEAVAKYYNADPETEYITVDVLIAFVKFLKDREFDTIDDAINDIREMLNTGVGDFRGDIDKILKEDGE